MGLLEAEDIVRYRLVQASLVAQLLNVKGIRHKPHIQHQISLQRKTIFKAEGGDVHRHAALLPLAVEDAQQLSPQFGGGKPGGVDDKVRPLLHREHQLPLLLHGLLQGIRLLLQGMAAACLLIPLDNGRWRRVQKQHPANALHALQFIQHVEELMEGLRRPHVIHQGHPGIPPAAPGAELRKL